jgi:AbrB family looped-hinge helix DNA binding protein
MNSITIRVYKNGRIAIPKKILKSYGLKQNDFIIVEQYADHISLIPAVIKPKINVK